jgi:hypothetical protein
MTVTLEAFSKDFMPEERAQVAARTAELVEEELTLRDLRQARRSAAVNARQLRRRHGRRTRVLTDVVSKISDIILAGPLLAP